MAMRRRLPAQIRRLIPTADGRAPRKPKADRSANNGVLARAGVGSELELILLNRMHQAGLPEPEKQFRFCPTRRWAADFAFQDARLLVECDGGNFTEGRHTRGKGFEDDCEKLSTAAAMGWRVIRVTRNHIKSGLAVTLIARALGLVAKRAY